MRWWTDRRQPWDGVTFWALDLETTGLDPQHDRILSVGMVPVREGLIRWGDRHYTLVRSPGKTSESGALGVHQILPGDTASAPKEEEVLTMSVMITCPICGKRNGYEFRFGGEERGGRPEEEGLTHEQWCDYVHMRTNSCLLYTSPSPRDS